MVSGPLLLALFLAGILTILLPCILPLLPIVLGVSIAGRSKLRPLFTVAGMLVSFVGFTFLLLTVLNQFVLAAEYIRIGTFYLLLLFGFGFTFHKRWILWLGAVAGSLFFLEFGVVSAVIAALLGIVGMEIGGKVATRIQGLGSGIQSSVREELGQDSPITAFLIGLTLGLVWVPCAGPALAFAFTLVREAPGLEALAALFSYGLGTAIPLLIVGYGGQSAVHSVRSVSKYSGIIKQIAGVLLILTAIGLYFRAFERFQVWLLDNTSLGDIGTRLEESIVGDVFTDDDDFTSTGETDGELPVLGTAPELTGLGTWHNSEPLTLAGLRGRVVLIDFWTYSCINCIRTFPELRELYSTYGGDDFTILGIHTPEFVFEKSDSNVADAVARNNLVHPVAQDNDYRTWRAFNNRFWPAKYLIDAEGNVRYVHFGEGAEQETEEAIRSLLREIGADLPEPVYVDGAAERGTRMRQTPEIYFGVRSWDHFGNKQGDPSEAAIMYDLPSDRALDQYYLDGTWEVEERERQVMRSDNGEIVLPFTGGEVNIVFGIEEGSEPGRATVFVDGTEVQSFTIDREDLYALWEGEYGDHELRIALEGSGIEAYAFTFGQ